MERIQSILASAFSKHGVWIQTGASLALMVAASFLDTVTGIAVTAVSALLLVLDPVVLLLQARRGGSRLQPGYLISAGLLLTALVFFFVRSKLNLSIDTIAEADESPLSRIRRLLLALFLFSYAGFFFYRLFICLGEGSSRSVEQAADVKRRTVLVRSLASLLAALPIFVLVNYLAHLRNPTLDLTPGYYSFGEASRTILKSVPVEVQVTVFLPELQAMKDPSMSRTQPELFRISEDVRVMAEQLPVINSNFKLKFRNADLDLTASQDFGPVNNGTLVLRVLKQGVLSADGKPYIERRVYVFNETDMERLEREIVRAAIQVSTPERKIYFTSLNGERWEFSDRARMPGGLETLKEALRFMNYQLHPLDMQSGWPGAVPEGADAVVIAGPTTAFSTEAKKAVLDYLQKGGRVMAAIDPAGGEDLAWLLEACDSTYRLQKSFMSSEPVLPGIPITDSFESHRITENLSLAGRAFIVLPESGLFAQKPPSAAPSALVLQSGNEKLKQSVFLYTRFNTVLDTNRNGRKDPGEESGRYPVALAFEYPDHKGARVVVFSGIGWMTDLGLRFRIDQRNIILAQDSLSYLLESPLAAALIPEQRKSRSIPITDELKFRNLILGVFAFPMGTVALIGLYVFWYRKRKLQSK